MPELPDVEAARRLIVRHLKGMAITAVDAPDTDMLRNISLSRLRRQICGARPHDVGRIGKWLFLHIGDGQLLIHLGMTGEFKWIAPAGPPARYERAALVTNEGRLAYLDRRRLGGWWWVPSTEQLATVTGDLGPDARRITATALGARLRSTKRSVKVALMNQQVVAGLGNMLSDEVLWRARLHPRRRADELTDDEVRRLHDNVRSTLVAAVRAGHIPRTSTWLSSQRAADRGICPRCSTLLAWDRINGRAALWCPRCQPP